MIDNRLKKSNIEIIPTEGCSGCTACRHVCPTTAITMTADSQGFKYPSVDLDKCIYCSKCVDVCPYGNEIFNCPGDTAYAVKSAGKIDQLSSTSGGFASVLTQSVINRGGRVFGVVLDDDLTVRTVPVDNVNDAIAFKGSKYVQTDLGNSLNEVADSLIQGKDVAFFGTSCHVDGLLHFLRQKRVDTTKLVTVDFLCHGVPSPLLFKQFCDYASRSRKMTSYLFRTKTHGWGTGSNRFAPTLVYGDRRDVDTPLARAWIDIFFSNNCLRPHCYQCPYASNHKRSADLTMADFWGLQNVLPDFFDADGVSLVLVNTTAGADVITGLNGIKTEQCALSDAVLKQGNFHNPSCRSRVYDRFWHDYTARGFSYILVNYTRYNKVGIIKYYIKKLLKKL